MNAYETLQVSPSAPIEVIRAAWTALIRQCHPDGPKPNKKRAQELNDAYAVLKDPVKRANLDRELRAASRQRTGNGTARNRPNRGNVHVNPTAYPQAYEGFGEQEIDEAIDELTQGVPPIVGKFFKFAHRQARGKA